MQQYDLWKTTDYEMENWAPTEGFTEEEFLELISIQEDRILDEIVEQLDETV